MELLERGNYLADLTLWLEAAVGGSGCIALVSGEAGIGKTSLLQEFSRQQRSARVLWGACDALFTPRPLAPLHDIARQTKGALLAAIDSGASRDRIFTAALDEFERGAAALVVFEDVHWADEATLNLLKFLGRRIQRTRTMLAVTYRDDEVGTRHPLRFVIGDFPRANTRRVLLSPLSKPAVEQLAKEAGRPLRDLHASTGGNPLLVTEVLAGTADSVPRSPSVTSWHVALRRFNLAGAAAELAREGAFHSSCQAHYSTGSFSSPCGWRTERAGRSALRNSRSIARGNYRIAPGGGGTLSCRTSACRQTRAGRAGASARTLLIRMFPDRSV